MLNSGILVVDLSAYCPRKYCEHPFSVLGYKIIMREPQGLHHSTEATQQDIDVGVLSETKLGLIVVIVSLFHAFWFRRFSCL